MANVVYGLLLRDLGSSIDRDHIDDALAGTITIRSTDDNVVPLTQPPDQIPAILPNARTPEELREMWGRTPDGIAAKLEFDAMAKRLPRQKGSGA